VPTPQAVAEAFSGHQFRQTYDHLSPDIRWVLVGGETLVGRHHVILTCEETLSELEGSSTEFSRFLTIAGADAVAVDAVARYTAADQTTSVVSSCDIYEFAGGLVTTITSYTAELAPAADHDRG